MVPVNDEPLPANKADLSAQRGDVKIAALAGLFKQLLFGVAGFIKGFFVDDTGNVSSMRALMLFAGVVILGTWAFVCIWNKSLVDLPVDVSALLFGLTGLKLTQRKIAEVNGAGGNDQIQVTNDQLKAAPTAHPEA